MSKEQIEEMAVTTCMLYRGYLDKKCAGSGDCNFNCHQYERCKKLYEKGYRRQSEGKNIGTVHPVDEFVCSECGIVLEGWTRVVTDEDDGELYYYEYEFKYCPNCGAKMKGGE